MAVAGEADQAPEHGEAVVAKTEAEETEVDAETGEGPSTTGVPNTPQIHQMGCVTAIIPMETRLGTVWHPIPAPGWTSVFQDNEGPASLIRKKKIEFNMTSFFQA